MRRPSRRLAPRPRRQVGGPTPPPPDNPVPTTTSLSPSSVTAGASNTSVVVTGTNFIAASVVRANGSDISTTFTDSTHVTGIIPSALLASAGTVSITVRNPAPGGGTSNAQTFTVNSGTLLPYTLSVQPAYWLDTIRYADASSGGVGAWVYAGMGPVTPAGTSPPTVTLSGTATAAVNMRIEITAAGALGTATYRLSLDGGVTFPQAGATAATVGPFAGITVAFAAGTYSTNNVYMSNVRITAAPSRESSTNVIDSTKTVSQGTVTGQPLLNLADAAYGGNPSLDFAVGGVSVQMSSGAWTTSLNQPSTYFFVGRNPLSQQPVAFDGPAGTRNLLYTSSGAPFNVIIAAGSFPTNTPGPWTGGVDIVVVIFNDPNSKIFLNATAAAASGIVSGTNGENRMFIGGANNNAAQNCWGKTLSQVLAYPTALSNADIISVASWLAGYAGGGSWTP